MESREKKKHKYRNKDRNRLREEASNGRGETRLPYRWLMDFESEFENQIRQVEQGNALRCCTPRALLLSPFDVRADAGETKTDLSADSRS